MQGAAHRSAHGQCISQTHRRTIAESRRKFPFCARVDKIGDLKLRQGTSLFLVLTVLYILHNDFWLWWRPDTLLGGIPIGLAYHVGYCVAVTIVMSVLVRRRLPSNPTNQ